MKFIEKLKRWMQGRYGGDELNRFLIFTALALMLLGFLFTLFGLWWLALPCDLLEWTAVIWAFYRMLSKKIYVRMGENRKFLAVKNRIVGFFKLRRAMFKDRKTHVYKTCPNCKSVLRLPRRPGHHTVKCIRCAHRFEVDVK